MWMTGMVRMVRSGLAAVFMALLSYSVAWSDSTNAPWHTLNLTPQQETRIQELDTQWQATYTQLQPQIEQDQATLRKLIQSPNSDANQVMHVQTRLQRNRDALHQSATRIFMEKKERLTPEQRQRLHRMMGG
ncbi:MAG: Spy/CpxP family protein refolding chaperone [Vampirovibrionales bacterium]